MIQISLTFKGHWSNKWKLNNLLVPILWPFDISVFGISLIPKILVMFWKMIEHVFGTYTSHFYCIYFCSECSHLNGEVYSKVVLLPYFWGFYFCSYSLAVFCSVRNVIISGYVQAVESLRRPALILFWYQYRCSCVLIRLQFYLVLLQATFLCTVTNTLSSTRLFSCCAAGCIIIFHATFHHSL